MEKNYIAPSIEITMITTEDIISTSSAVETPWLSNEEEM